MGLWPTRGNENLRCRPRESGDPLSVHWIPAFAGMTERVGFSGEGIATCPLAKNGKYWSREVARHSDCPELD
jgi:hypothetical protein